VSESFNQTSNIFDQPNPLSIISVSGSTPSPQQAVIPPTANQITNGTNGQITYQCGENCLIGVTGAYSSLRFSNSTQLTGLYNSSSGTASTFYARRFRAKYYLGASYQFQDLSSYPPGTLNASSTHTQTQLLFGFLTAYLNPSFTVSLSIGPQHYITTQTDLPTTRSWSPVAKVSASWQGSRTRLAASYSRIVTNAGGLNGIFQSNSADISASWRLCRTWTIGIGASYFAYQDLMAALSPSSTEGHTTLGTVSVQHPLGEHFSLQAGYNHVQQTYHSTVSAIPTTGRVFISVGYIFQRPL
jgi:hypothetical protein